MLLLINSENFFNVFSGSCSLRSVNTASYGPSDLSFKQEVPCPVTPDLNRYSLIFSSLVLTSTNTLEHARIEKNLSKALYIFTEHTFSRYSIISSRYARTSSEFVPLRRSLRVCFNASSYEAIRDASSTGTSIFSYSSAHPVRFDIILSKASGRTLIPLCQAWHKGIKVLPEALDKMMSNLTGCAEEYENMDVPVDDASLIASYEDALKHTLRERLSGTNSDDVLAYRLEMIEYLEKVCSVKMYRAFERFFSILACSSVFVEVKTKLENIREYLLRSGVTGQGTSCLKDRSEGPYEAVFTDLKEHDPEKTLKKFSELISNNI